MDDPLTISCRETAALLSDDARECLLVDCRQPDEHALVALPDSRLIPLGDIPSRVDELRDASHDKPDRLIIVYCHHGMRSAQATAWLHGQGIKNARSLDGGIDVWAQEIDPSLPRY